MKKILLSVLMLAVYSAATAVVIQGEVSPGTYANVAVDSSGNIAVGSSSLPTGAATAAKQDTGNTAISAIGAQLPATLGAKTGAASISVVPNTNTTFPVSGTLTAVTTVGTITNPLPAGANVLGFVSADQSGTWTVQPGNTANTTAWKVDGSAVTQPVSGTITEVTTVGTITNSVTVAPTISTITNRSGTITSGGTAQTIMSANATRKYLLIQNTSDTTMWCNFTTTAVATQPSFQLIPGASFTMEGLAVSSEAISCIGATTGKIFTAKEM